MKIVSRVGLIALTPLLLAVVVASIQFYASDQVDLAHERSARAQLLQDDIVTVTINKSFAKPFTILEEGDEVAIVPKPN